MLFYKRIKLIAGFSFFLLFGCGYSPLIDMNQTNYFMLDKGQFIIFAARAACNSDFYSDVSVINISWEGLGRLWDRLIAGMS